MTDKPICDLKDLTNMSDVDVLRLIAKDFGITCDFDIEIVDEKKGAEKEKSTISKDNIKCC